MSLSKKPTTPLIDGITLFFAGLALLGGGLLWWRDGDRAIASALGNAAALALAILPLVLLAVLVAAYAQKLMPAALAERWLGGRSGWRGLILATAAGAVTPGGPFSAFPLVAGLRQVGASPPVCVAYLTAWSVIGIQRVLVWELAFFGPQLVAIRLLVSLPLPLLAGLLTMALQKGRSASA